MVEVGRSFPQALYEARDASEVSAPMAWFRRSPLLPIPGWRCLQWCAVSPQGLLGPRLARRPGVWWAPRPGLLPRAAVFAVSGLGVFRTFCFPRVRLRALPRREPAGVRGVLQGLQVRVSPALFLAGTQASPWKHPRAAAARWLLLLDPGRQGLRVSGLPSVAAGSWAPGQGTALPVSSLGMPARGSGRARGGPCALAPLAESAGCSGRRLLCGACSPTEFSLCSRFSF